MTKLLWLVWSEGKQLLEVTVEDPTGKRRRIDVKWKSRGHSPVPPNWWSMVEGEVEFQRSDELERASGRALPFK